MYLLMKRVFLILCITSENFLIQGCFLTLASLRRAELQVVSVLYDCRLYLSRTLFQTIYLDVNTIGLSTTMLQLSMVFSLLPSDCSFATSVPLFNSVTFRKRITLIINYHLYVQERKENAKVHVLLEALSVAGG